MNDSRFSRWRVSSNSNRISARSHVLLGDIYHQLERYDDAQAEYQKALSLAPCDPAAMLGLASAYLSNNNPKGAMEIAQSALLASRTIRN